MNWNEDRAEDRRSGASGAGRGRFRGLAALVVAAVAAVPAFGADVIVVDDDPGPGVDFTSLPQAVAVAPEGAILLLRPGVYAPTLVDGKALTILADPQGGARPVLRQLTVKGLLGEQAFVLRGVDIDLDLPSGYSSALTVFGAYGLPLFQHGTLLFEDVHVRVSAFSLQSLRAAEIYAALRVTFVRCTLEGGDAVASTGQTGGDGLFAWRSRVALYDCVLLGGAGAAADGAFGVAAADGGVGLVDEESDVILAGCLVKGGAGGAGASGANGCVEPADGGAAVELVGVDSRLVEYGSNLEGGPPGQAAAGCPSTALPGGTIVGQTQNVQSVLEVVRGVEVSSPAVDGGTIAFDAKGQAGDVLVVFVSPVLDGTFLDKFAGSLVPGLPAAFFVLGPLPGGGAVHLDVPLPQVLPAGVEGIMLFLQPIGPAGSVEGLLGAPSALGLLSSN